MEKLLIGQIARPFGIKGEVKIKLFTDFADQRFAIGNTLQVIKDDFKQEVVVASFRMHQGFALILFKDVTSINDIEHLRNAQIFIDSSAIHTLEDGEFYYFQLNQCQVISDEGQVLGTVTEVIDSKAHPILRIKTDHKDLLIPYVDAFILDVNLEKNIITVRLIEGML